MADGKVVVVSQETLDSSMEDFVLQMVRRRGEKGYNAFSSLHDILGAVTEEHHEVEHAIHDKDKKAVEDELLDLAVACLWGVASLRARARS